MISQNNFQKKIKSTSTLSQLISEKECIKEALERSEKKIVEVEAQFDKMVDLHKAVSV